MFVCFLCIAKWRKCETNPSFITKSGKVSVFTVKSKHGLWLKTFNILLAFNDQAAALN